MRIFSALALAVGLMLGTTSVALASPEPDGTEVPTEDAKGTQDEDAEVEIDEDVEDSSPTPSPTETATSEPTPTPTETDPDRELNNGETDIGGETTPPPPEGVAVNCYNATVTAGQSTTVTCNTDPSSATLSVNSVSQIGGNLTTNGNQLVYEAPAEVATTTTDDFTVIASAPDHENGTAQVTFTVEPAADSAETSPTPPQTTTSPADEDDSATPENGEGADNVPEADDSPTQESGLEEADPAQTPSAAPGNTSGQPTVTVQPPGAPATVEEQTPAGSMLLPVPGMPGLIELIIPPSDGAVGSGPSAGAEETDPSPEAESGNEQGSLARTGTGAAFSAAALGGLAVALGASVLFTSRRLR
ncbi:hypothetical protein FEF26_07420 [Nesterenkonia salmonea]|uniref:Gram-positive cocci surface proteins LPxTG domain-containing protein n=1 Tax=Nesterenkonia salmonea TaxID=1804987 RepID=A0A5R9BB07_9MICC|nr:hypothetical protein [Nesterenkonia salmonea]TLP97425.1 hypothetical protein FEF26_07420 [Nesterenkonia salmonea]